MPTFRDCHKQQTCLLEATDSVKTDSSSAKKRHSGTPNSVKSQVNYRISNDVIASRLGTTFPRVIRIPEQTIINL